jgi:hypothetical protein
MKKFSHLTTFLRVFVVLPIWFYLVWWLLERNNAGELQMFLFWVYVPLNIIVVIVAGFISYPGKTSE